MKPQSPELRRSWSLGRKLGLTAWFYIVSILVNVAMSSACLLLYFRPAFGESNLLFQGQQRLEQARSLVRQQRAWPDEAAVDGVDPQEVRRLLSQTLLDLGAEEPEVRFDSPDLKEIAAIKAELRSIGNREDLSDQSQLAAAESLLTRAIGLLGRQQQYSLGRASRAQHWVTGLLVANSLVGAVLCVTGLWFVRRSVVQPAVVLKDAAHQIRLGNFAPRITLPFNDEMGDLGREMSAMAGQIARLQEQLVEQERLAAAGDLIERVEQHVREPLAAIRRLAGRNLERNRGNPELAQCQERIGATVRRFEDWLGHLRAGLACPAGDPTPVEVDKMFMEVVAAVQPALERHRVELVTQVNPGLPEVKLDVLQFEQALISLVTNAIQASSAGQIVHLGAKPCESMPGWLHIDVIDQGVGMAPELMEKIFVPFFTTKPEGTGIGLGLVKSIVHQRGGELSVRSAPSQGSQFTIRLPERFTDSAGTDRPRLAKPFDDRSEFANATA
jgi:signal transduction histidine kinase